MNIKSKLRDDLLPGELSKNQIEIKNITLKGTEKQIAYAEDLLISALNILNTSDYIKGYEQSAKIISALENQTIESKAIIEASHMIIPNSCGSLRMLAQSIKYKPALIDRYIRELGVAVEF